MTIECRAQHYEHFVYQFDSELSKAPRGNDETLHFFLADRLTKENEGGGDESEDIEVIQVPVHKAESFLEEQSKSFIIDVKSYIGMYFADRLNLE